MIYIELLPLSDLNMARLLTRPSPRPLMVREIKTMF